MSGSLAPVPYRQPSARERILTETTADCDGWPAALAAHKERTRSRILTAATEIVVARGASELAMTTLARRAGVARATLYSYFPNAGSVLEALVEVETQAFIEDLEHRLDAIPDVRGHLGETVLALTAWVGRQTSRQPAHPRRRRTTRSPDIASIHRPLAILQRRIGTVIAESVEAGVLPADTDQDLAAGFVVTLVFGFRDRLGGPEHKHVADSLHRFVLSGLGAVAPAIASGKPHSLLSVVGMPVTGLAARAQRLQRAFDPAKFRVDEAEQVIGGDFRVSPLTPYGGEFGGNL
jgi:AcrR family transcriptional regulator